MIRCPVCQKHEATKHPTLGTLACEVCRNARRTSQLSEIPEFTSDEIKSDRKKYAKDIVQPFRAGEVSKEYIEAYGTKGLNITKEEAAKAVPTTDSYYG